MAPNACSHCRSKKLKCVTQADQRACIRCSTRDLACSYEPATIRQRLQPDSQTVPNLPNLPIEYHAPAEYPSVYRLREGYVGLDISRGRPQEILREGQLTQSILQLYFINYGDIHFMLDEETLLRQLAIGEVPKVLIYSIMALAIRFSHAPFDDEGSTANRGEPMFDHARHLLQQDFDRMSITNVQVYILLSTYKLTYGGLAQAYTFLSIAANMIQLLRIMEFDAEIDPLRVELDRRLVATMMTMDQLVSGSLRLPLLISPQYATPTVISEDEFWTTKRRNTTSMRVASNPATQTYSMPNHILRLSRLMHTACKVYWGSGSDSDNVFTLSAAVDEDRRLSKQNWDRLLLYTEENLARHRATDSIRIFLLMHLLDSHIGQVAHFCSLHDHRPRLHLYSPDTPTSNLATDRTGERQHECYRHAHAVVTIVEYALTADIDLHNFQVGQILVVATVVLTHEILTRAAGEVSFSEETTTTTTTTTTMTSPGQRLPDTTSMAVRISTSTEIRAIRECIVRSRRHTRMFDWVLQQFEMFCQLCSSSTLAAVCAAFDKNTQLLREVLRIGSFYERWDPRTGARREGIEALFYPDASSPP